MLKDIPSDPNRYPFLSRAARWCSIVGTSIVFAAMLMLTLDSAARGFSPGKSGCLGAEFGSLVFFVAFFVPAWPVAFAGSLWMQRWKSAGALIFGPWIWLVFMATMS